jgi:hypothetical protein
LRFPVPDRRGIQSGLYVCNPEDYNLQTVSRKQRSHVKQGLEHCEIRLMSGDELASQGLDLNRQTLERQGRSEEAFLDPRKWRQFGCAVEKSPGMMTWGAFMGGRLSTYIVGCRDGEWLHLMYKASRTEDLPQHINHALDFFIASSAAADLGIRRISNGSVSVSPNEGLDRYKRQMGYSILEQNHAIYFHPLFAPALSSRTSVALSRAAANKFCTKTRIFDLSRMMEGALMSREPQEGMSVQVKSAADKAAVDAGCQQEDPVFSKLARPGVLFPILRAAQTLRESGIRNTAQQTVDFLNRKMGQSGKKTPAAAAPRPFTPDETLGLQPGDWVEVKSEAEIRATLDARGKNRGLLFTDEMISSAGKRFRVHKRVESIFLEESKQRRTIKNTVLLEHSYCQGKMFNCDRSCFLFWKEIWLRKIEGPEQV